MSTAEPPDPRGDRHGEPQTARDDRNLAELLQELRVAGLGVQVLFGFLLGMPFTARFGKLTDSQRGLYVTDLVLAAVATVLLVAPVAYHRLVFRQRQKERLIRASNIMAIAGLMTVALAVSGTVLLITSFVVPGVPAAILTGLVFCLFASLWVVLPLARLQRTEANAASGPAPPHG
jgi:Family of unknown function (DUF6328)